nr:3-phosphoinositide-dependent protein kinase 1 [Tanacetum cinerariifolium]
MIELLEAEYTRPKQHAQTFLTKFKIRCAFSYIIRNARRAVGGICLHNNMSKEGFTKTKFRTSRCQHVSKNIKQPKNMLLTSDGHIKIVDFGSVKPMQDNRITVIPNAASGVFSFVFKVFCIDRPFVRSLQNLGDYLEGKQTPTLQVVKDSHLSVMFYARVKSLGSNMANNEDSAVELKKLKKGNEKDGGCTSGRC